MCKKVNSFFYENLTFEKLLQAHTRARKQKLSKREVLLFEMDLESSLANLLRQMKNKKYKLGSYREFVIYEPKERIIKSLPYRDRVVHQWYVEEFIKKYIVPKFIYHSFACIDGKGTHKAVEAVQNYMIKMQKVNKDFWILKCDVKKFFYNINQDILYSIICKYFKDKEILEFSKILIFDENKNSRTGIPIGNYTSQYFANIYLNELDQYVKRELKIKCYVRYMDDFVLILNTKAECKEVKQKIQAFLKEKLLLELNEKSRYYPNQMGVNFCGYRIFTTHRKLRNSSKKKIKKNVKIWNKLYRERRLNIEKALQSLNSWRGHATHCNSYKLQNKIINECEFIYTPEKL